MGLAKNRDNMKKRLAENIINMGTGKTQKYGKYGNEKG